MLRDCVAVVTGGTRGIGLAISDRLVAYGAEVITLSRTSQPSRATQSVVCDVSDEAAVGSTIEKILADHGRIDVLVNNAGVTHGRMIHNDNLQDFERVLRVNLMGPWLCTRAVLPSMRAAGSGAIVNVGSMAGKLGNLGQGAYSASKAGVVALTKTAAREGAGSGIRVNAVQPGLIETEMTSLMDREAYERILSSVPMRRPGTADEVAEVVAFLASDRSSYLTGCVIDVAGGRGM